MSSWSARRNWGELAGEDAPLELLDAFPNLLDHGEIRIDDGVRQRIQQGAGAVVERVQVGVQA